MKSFLKAVGGILLSTLVLLVLLEVTFRFIGAPGASRYVEKVIIQEGLTPQKPKNEFRIFAYGESTMHGSHYGPYSNTARWLAEYLKDLLPDRKVRVVNFARMGKGSDFILNSFRDTLAYKPDLAVFYMGHNEFLHENKKREVEAERGTFSYQFKQLMRQSYFLSTVSRWAIEARMKRKGSEPEDSIEYRTIETPPSGIGPENAVPRSSAYYRENVDFFRQNLERILSLAKRAKVPVIFFRPVSNLKDFAPFYSLHLKKLSSEDMKQWEAYYEAGVQLEDSGRPGEAWSQYEKAYALDDTYAMLSFRMGRLALKRGELERAKKLFTEAKDNDAIIVRSTREIEKTLGSLQKEHGFDLIDTERILVAEAPGGILGEPIIEDNVHFSIKGHALTAHALAELISRRGWIAPENEWRFGNERSFEDISRALGVDKELLVDADLKMVAYFGSRFDNRVRFAEKALELDPGNTKALRHLAWSYWLMDEKTNALDVYERLGALDPKALEEVFAAQPEIKKAFEARE